MEPRFGHDFSRVRVHTDAKAAESARAVNALAYTVGSDVVFGAHQHAPHSPAGRELLAHELAHVIQQRNASPASEQTRISQPSDSGEQEAESLSRSALLGDRIIQPSTSASMTLSRRVIPRAVHCTGGSDGAPADATGELTTLVDRAEAMARLIASLLRSDAVLVRDGARPLASPIDQAFADRFGEPPAANGGFMNRLTGAVRPTFEIALSEEIDITAGRYEMIAGQFDRGFVHYLCMSTERSFGGCTITNCERDAWACPNVNAIFLCPGFWNGGDTSSALLIHEAAHMIWERVVHGAAGSGGNFRHAECYASVVSEIFQVAPGEPECFIP
jgi:hypothetical protein